jgi:hypothetical protein
LSACHAEAFVVGGLGVEARSEQSFMTKFAFPLLVVTLAGSMAHAQIAAPSSVNLQAEPTPLSSPVASPTVVDLQPEPTPYSSPTVATPTPIPDIPELSVLDEGFKQSSLGKAADVNRQRTEIRKLQNRVAAEPSVVAARKAAERPRTDLQKREALREYYNLYYGRMRSLASGEATRKALDDLKAERLRLLDQPRVRPSGDETAPAVEVKERKKGKRSRPEL